MFLCRVNKTDDKINWKKIKKNIYFVVLSVQLSLSFLQQSDTNWQMLYIKVSCAALGSMLLDDRPIENNCTNWYQLKYTFSHFSLPLKSHMLKSLLLKDFSPKIQTACRDAPSNNCKTLYLITVAPDTGKTLLTAAECSEAGWHFSSDRTVWTAPLKIGKERRGEERGRREGELSVCVVMRNGTEGK